MINIFKTKDIYLQMCRKSPDLHALSAEERLMLQDHLRKIYLEIEKVCDRHQLTVMLADGSVLGALRHKGFIPWDDDIDLNMSRKDYEAFIDKYSSELPSNYIVFAPNSKNGPISNFCKVMDMNTEIVHPGEEEQMNHYGISVDIFPLESIDPDRPLYNKWKRICSLLLIYIAASVSQYKSHSLLYRKLMSGSAAARFNYWFREFIGFIFSFKHTSEWQNAFDSYVRNVEDTGFVHRPSDFYRWEPIPQDVFFPVKKVPFDDINAYIPNKAIDILEYDFGDWHIVPKPEDRWEHFLVSIKFSK